MPDRLSLWAVRAVDRPSGDAVRVQICHYLRANPGAHFRDIQRNLSLGPGQTVHHLRKLVDDGLVVERRSARYAHYFLPGTPVEGRLALGALRHPARRAVALEVQRLGPRTLRELTEATGLATSTLHHHLTVLLQAGVLVGQGPRPARYRLAPVALDALAELTAEGPGSAWPPVPGPGAGLPPAAGSAPARPRPLAASPRPVRAPEGPPRAPRGPGII